MEQKIEVQSIQLEDIKDDSLLIIRVGSDVFPAANEDIENAIENLRALMESAGLGTKGVHALVTNHCFKIELMTPDSDEYKKLEAIFADCQQDD